MTFILEESTMKYSTKRDQEEDIVQFLLKKGLIKNFKVGQIVIVKLKDGSNPWPGKITQFFIQETKQKKTESLEQDYDPGADFSSHKKTKNAKHRPTSKKQQLIYKIRYYNCQEFVFSEEKFIDRYTLEKENQLEALKDRTLSKALELARRQMTEEQREKVMNGTVEGKKSNLVAQEEKTKKVKKNQSKQRKQRKQLRKDYSNDKNNYDSENEEEKKGKDFEESQPTQVENIDKKTQKKMKVQQKMLKLKQSLEKQAKKLRKEKTSSREQQENKQSPKESQEDKNKNDTGQKDQKNPNHKTKEPILLKKSFTQENPKPNRKKSTNKKQKESLTKVIPSVPSTQPIVKQQYEETQQKVARQPGECSYTLSNDSNSESEGSSSQFESDSSQKSQDQKYFNEPGPESSHNITIMSESLPQDESTPMLVGEKVVSKKPLKKIVKEEYLLDDVLYKNKYQLMGVFSQLLQWCLTKILWVEKQSQKKLSSQSSQIITLEDQKNAVAFKKILDAEIFTLQELDKAECVQKMLNVIKIGQLTQIQTTLKQDKTEKNQKTLKSKTLELSKKISEHFNKELLKIYSAIRKQLKNLGILGNSLENSRNRYMKSFGPQKRKVNECSFGDVRFQLKKNEEETNASNCVEAVSPRKGNGKKQQISAKSKGKSRLKIDYKKVFSLSSNEVK